MKRPATQAKRVFVGLSGGVDSSVSAALLLDQGYDVTGVFIKVWHPDFLPCNWREERLDAMRVCAKLGIQFLTFDFEKEYKKDVVDYMIAEYKAGKTPNPDVMCNRHIKFGAFWKKAKALGADYIATGHYAQVASATSGKTSGKFEMLSSADKEKDQTYFLWTLTQSDLSHILFPVGYLEKSEVRSLAKKYNLQTAEKKDSQGLCFIGHVDMKDFLAHYIKPKKGKVLDENGREIGSHEGAYFYTIGQRHGFEITKKSTNDAPLYITARDVKKNTLTVSSREHAGENIPQKKGQKNPPPKTSEFRLQLEKTNWIDERVIKEGQTYTGRVRYRQELQECRVTINKAELSYAVVFKKPQIAVSPGQSFVLYDKKGRMCIGGGVIAEV